MKVMSLGLCWAHYLRNRRYGSPTFKPTRSDRGVPKGDPLAAVETTAGAHARIYRLWGAASQYECVECGELAKDWAYDGTDQTALMQLAGKARGVRFSLYPEFYMPLCRRCHNGRDRREAANELFEYRAWKYATGKTLEAV